ncbi:MAG: hypothetical protein LIO51_08640 [Clostridiales bacterium]|nr:hypothetical protein [Clostridiales bacterium]
MTTDSRDFAGSRCGCRYEREKEHSVRDCLTFYIDGRVLFERYCYGEAAGLVFQSWASGFDEKGVLLWGEEPTWQGHRDALPKQLTDIQEDGAALKFDDRWQRYVRTQELDSDPEHGYGAWKLFWLRRKGRG